MDDVDLARRQTEQFRRLALQQARRTTATGESARICRCCGRSIPEARRRAMPGCVLCVDCMRRQEAAR